MTKIEITAIFNGSEERRDMAANDMFMKMEHYFMLSPLMIIIN